MESQQGFFRGSIGFIFPSNAEGYILGTLTNRWLENGAPNFDGMKTRNSMGIFMGELANC